MAQSIAIRSSTGTKSEWTQCNARIDWLVCLLKWYPPIEDIGDQPVGLEQGRDNTFGLVWRTCPCTRA